MELNPLNVLLINVLIVDDNVIPLIPANAVLLVVPMVNNLPLTSLIASDIVFVESNPLNKVPLI